MISKDLSIAIVTHHSNYEILELSIKALNTSIKQAIEHQKIKGISLYIVDNSKDEKYIADLKIIINKYFSQDYLFTLKVLAENRGYGHAHNIILSKINSDFHIVMNPDVIVENNCIVNALNYMNFNPDVGLISPNAETETGEKLYLLKRYPPLLILFIRGFFPKISRSIILKEKSEHYEMRDINQSKEYKGTDIASGCFMFFRTQAIKNKFKFSEKFFLYFEDYDLSWQFSNYSKIAYVPSIKIIHYGGNAARKGIKHIFYFIRSAITFYNRYGWKLI